MLLNNTCYALEHLGVVAFAKAVELNRQVETSGGKLLCCTSVVCQCDSCLTVNIHGYSIFEVEASGLPCLLDVVVDESTLRSLVPCDDTWLELEGHLYGLCLLQLHACGILEDSLTSVAIVVEAETNASVLCP